VTLLDRRLVQRYGRLLLGDEDNDEDAMDSALLARLQQLLSTRYCVHRVQREGAPRFAWFLSECSDREFLRSFRMERSSFARLVTMIEGCEVFAHTHTKKKKATAAAHLLVFLKYIGTSGSDACIEHLALMFGIGSGSAFDYITRTTRAVISLYEDIVHWPTGDERKLTSQRIQASVGFPNCVGLVDGTLLPLAFKPTLNGEDYFTRKGGYALNSLLFCDDRARVIYMVTGWPGSSYDNRVWSNCAVCRYPEKFFAGGEYILGDSAFRPSRRMIPPFKNLPGAVVTRERDFFNSKLAKVRVRTEHCIGLIKARFQFFKGVRIIIRGKKDMRRILRLFQCACVLHNLLLDDPVDPELQSAIEMEEASEEIDVVTDTPADTGSDCGAERREQLFNFLVECDGRF